MSWVRDEDNEDGLPMVSTRRKNRSQTFLAQTLKNFRPRNYPKVMGKLFLALRGAIFIVIAALPVYIEVIQQWFPASSKPVTGYTGFFFVLTFSTSVGKSLQFFLQNFCGLLFAVLNLWLVAEVVDASPGNDGPNSTGEWAFFWCDQIISMLLVLTVNCSAKTKAAFFAMQAFFQTSLAIKHLGLDWRVSAVGGNAGSGLGMLFYGSWGMLCAVLAVSIPYPMFAFRKMQNSTKGASDNLSKKFSQVFDLFTGTERSVLICRWDARVTAVAAQIRALQQLAPPAWWECFGYGRWGRAHLFMTRYQVLLRTLSDIVLAMRVPLQMNSFGEYHNKVSPIYSSAAAEIFPTCYEIMDILSDCCTKGVVTADDIGRCQQLKSILEEGLQRVATAFHQVITIGDDDLAPTSRVERAFYFNVSRYAKQIILVIDNLGEDACDDALFHFQPAKRVSAARHVFNYIKSFLPPMTWRYANYIFRNFISLISAFLIGFYAFSDTGDDYTGNNNTGFLTMGTVGGLMSMHSGATSDNLFLRVPGLAVATVWGGLMKWFLGGQNTGSRIGLAACLLCFEFFFLYRHYSSRKRSYMFLIIAMFGAIFTIFPGVDEPHAPVYQMLQFQLMRDTVVGAAICFLIDYIFCYDKPSQQCVNHIFNACDKIRLVLHDIINGQDIKRDDWHHNYPLNCPIQKEIDSALHYCTIAESDHNFFGIAWPGDAVRIVIRQLSEIRIAIGLLLLENARDTQPARRGSKHPGERWRDLRQGLVSDPSWKEIGSQLLDNFDDSVYLLQRLLYRNSERPPYSGIDLRRWTRNQQIEMTHFVEVMNQRLHDDRSITTIEDHPTIRCSLLLFFLNRTDFAISEISATALQTCRYNYVQTNFD